MPSRPMGKEIEADAPGAGKIQHLSTSHPAQKFVTIAATRQCSRMERAEVAGCVKKPNFGQRICRRICGDKISIYNRVAQLAIPHSQFKDTALESKLWSLRWQSEWLHQPINLARRSERDSFRCIPDIYNYTGTPPGTLVVDFANKFVGGGCFGHGFVQEEQMVLQCCSRRTWRHSCMHISKNCHGIKYLI